MTNTGQITCKIKLDEPLHMSTPFVSNDEIIITSNDASGITNFVLVYSTDGMTWEKTNMNSQGDTFSAKPISSVQTTTNVQYYFEVTDGDYDHYIIDNNGQKFSYTIEPSAVGIINFNATSGVWLTAVILTIVIVVVLGLIYIKVLKKRGNHGTIPSNL